LRYFHIVHVNLLTLSTSIKLLLISVNTKSQFPLHLRTYLC